MFARLLCLLLVLGVAVLVRPPAAVQSVAATTVMTCCADGSPHGTCPSCPSSPGDAQKCCASPLPLVWFVSAHPEFRHVLTAESFSVLAESFPVRGESPLLPPPKVS